MKKPNKHGRNQFETKKSGNEATSEKQNCQGTSELGDKRIKKLSSHGWDKAIMERSNQATTHIHNWSFQPFSQD